LNIAYHFTYFLSNRCKDLENDNKVLRNYFNNTTTDATSQNQIISLLRSDQQKAEMEKDYYAKQAERYKAQLEQTQKNYDEVQALLLKVLFLSFQFQLLFIYFKSYKTMFRL